MTYKQPTALVAVRCYNPQVIAAVLLTQFRSNSERIGGEFPEIPRQFRDYNSTLDTLKGFITRGELRGEGAAHAWVAAIDGQITGLAVATHTRLMGVGMNHREVLVEGPLLKVWLRPRTRRPWAAQQLSEILPLLAQEFAKEDIQGTPFALVRPTLGHAIGCLTDTANGFGGFYAPRPLSDYTRADGNPALRTLYIPNGIQLP